MTSKRRKWVFSFLSVIAVVALVAYFTREREPTYQGKPLSEWAAINAAKFYDVPDHDAEAAIRHIGTNALPFLLKWTRYEPSKHGFRSSVKSALRHLPDSVKPQALQDWVAKDSNYEKAVCASEAFEPLGEMGRTAIPELTRLMNDPAFPTASRRAVYALGDIGTPALPILLAQLTNTNAPHRFDVASLFGMIPELGTNDASVRPMLVNCLKDPDVLVRLAVALALGRRARDDRSQANVVIPALINCLTNNSDGRIREAAMRSLAEYGDQARQAVPVLLSTFADADWPISDAVTNALRRIAPEVLTNATLKVDLAAQARICFRNLRALDAAKHQWALVKDQPDSATPSVPALLEYLGTTNLPACPGGGTYQLLPVDQFPRCSITSHNDNPF